MSILSIQSHVAYGYVGNKAAVYPLQNMGYDVWPVHTVQFSNHTGYGKWQGEVFTAEHVEQIVQGIEALGKASECQAILSGYMGSSAICEAVARIAKKMKEQNSKLLYLCDPVIGNTNCFVKPEVLDFFKSSLVADIITPNQFEAETLSGMKIADTASLKAVAGYFHNRGTKIVVITGIELSGSAAPLHVFVSHEGKAHMIATRSFAFTTPVNGTGDLFSALFLGHYLKSNDAPQSLQYTVGIMEKVMENTFNAKARELQVLSVDYKNIRLDTLPKFVAL